MRATAIHWEGADIWMFLQICWISRHGPTLSGPFLLNVSRLISAEDCEQHVSNMSSRVLSLLLRVVCVCVCVCVYVCVCMHFCFFITSISEIFYLTHWLYLCVHACVCVFGSNPSPFQLGQSPVPAVLIISVWRWLAQFSRNRGVFSMSHTLT